MKPFFTLMTALIVVTLALSGVTAAQDNASAIDDIDQDELDELLEEENLPDHCNQPIDENIILCDATLDDNDVVHLEFYSLSERPQTISLIDAGAFQTGGHVTERQARALPEQTTTTTIPLTVVDGYAGVSIGTTNTIYVEVIEHGSEPFLPGQPTNTDPLIAGATVFALFAIGFPTGYYMVRRVLGGVHREW